MNGRTHILKSNIASLICYMLLATLSLSCDNKSEQKINRRAKYIRQIPGNNDSIPIEVIEKGNVLIGYSHCRICHKVDKRSIGPAFRDIAERYPANKIYIEMLAYKVITGGSGSWGSAVMPPHAKISIEDAKMMATYILSLKENSLIIYDK